MKTSLLVVGALTASGSAKQRVECAPSDDDCHPAPSCGKHWAQCGGIDFVGSSCCQADSTCKKWSTWFSQCVPNSVLHETEESSVGIHVESGSGERLQQEIIVTAAESVKIVTTFMDTNVKEVDTVSEQYIDYTFIVLPLIFLTTLGLLHLKESKERKAPSPKEIVHEASNYAAAQEQPCQTMTVASNTIERVNGKGRSTHKWWRWFKKSDKDKAANDRSDRQKKDYTLDKHHNIKEKKEKKDGSADVCVAILLIFAVGVLALLQSPAKQDTKESKKRRQK
ncbi:hypothetical protein AC1031_006096 [Aphanomyces cochlioides]|nr:hypothetical protein AC1031_006096 [Aphanomyces cochlioides]